MDTETLEQLVKMGGTLRVNLPRGGSVELGFTAGWGKGFWVLLREKKGAHLTHRILEDHRGRFYIDDAYREFIDTVTLALMRDKRRMGL